jgi:hypothetical protein
MHELPRTNVRLAERLILFGASFIATIGLVDLLEWMGGA